MVPVAPDPDGSDYKSRLSSLQFQAVCKSALSTGVVTGVLQKNETVQVSQVVDSVCVDEQ